LNFNAEGSRLARLVEGRKTGKKAGEGFYVWKDGKPQKSEKSYDKRELERLGAELVEPLIAEAQRSLDEGVVQSADLVDAGVIFGTGFAPFRGGPLHYKATRRQGHPSMPQRAAAE
jgi:3-hydroxyacyl-CoA dehydrogenase/enoyl-CoA hydratase/3-hydroxybutyryl-CoA epimerase